MKCRQCKKYKAISHSWYCLNCGHRSSKILTHRKRLRKILMKCIKCKRYNRVHEEMYCGKCRTWVLLRLAKAGYLEKRVKPMKCEKLEGYGKWH